MQALKERNLKDIPYILTDKDFAEINAAQTVWPEAHLQLCVWHMHVLLNNVCHLINKLLLFL